MKITTNNKVTSKVPVFLGGVVVGLLLAGEAFLALNSKLIPPPQVKVITVTKVVTKTKVVDHAVEHTTVVKEAKLYRAQRLDENGNVVEQWIITKCKFRVIGAQLTDKDGKTFEVHGNIRVEPITE